MSRWSDPDEWERLRNGAACPICSDGKPFGILAELEVSYVTSGEEAALKGSCAIFLKRHAVELYELSPEVAAAFAEGLREALR